MTSIYDFSAKTLSGEEKPLKSYEGQVAVDREYRERLRIYASI